ncbi:MAG: chemotaxis protein CheR [Methylotenera sp.]|nr:MAG: chemotaxis protein CheR [Methylotenera sp.]
MPSTLHDSHLLQLSEFVAEKIGLYFPRERWDDLKRGLAAASQEIGFKSPEACMEWLLTSTPEKAHLQILASHLTIGETYFFRDKPLLEALTQHILPGLISKNRSREQRLRFWCAGCCSGEEAYTLAILLHQLLPDLRDWQITITATDINLRFLEKATKGFYSEWSFRNAPTWLKKRYFQPYADGRYALIPEIKQLVNFGHLNLVEDAYPSLANNTNAMDLVFCRNVLMYFSPTQTQKVISNLSKSIIEGGWLLVSPSEASKALFPQFRSVHYPGAILFQKNHPSITNPSRPSTAITHPPFAASADKAYIPRPFKPTAVAAFQPISVKANDPSAMLALAQSLYTQGNYAEVADTLCEMINQKAPRHSYLEAFSLLARAFANLGRLKDALLCCDRWIAADKIDAAAYYMRALVLMERGDVKQAQTSFQQAIFLRPNFVQAYFSLGSIAHHCGKTAEACKHFSIAQRLLITYAPEEVLPESDNLTAGQLTDIINAMPIMETVS